MERIVADEELTTMVREFRASVSADLDEMHGQIAEVRSDIAGMQGQIAEVRSDIAEMQGQIAGMQGQISAMQGQIDVTQRRIDDLGHELRNRISTSETAILNEIRDLSGRLDRRFEAVEGRVGVLERRAGTE